MESRQSAATKNVQRLGEARQAFRVFYNPGLSIMNTRTSVTLTIWGLQEWTMLVRAVRPSQRSDIVGTWQEEID